MEINILLLVNLLLYSMVASQPFIYLVALRNVQQHLTPAAYIEFRQLVDKNFQVKFRVVMYLALLSGSLLTLWCSMNLNGLLFKTAAVGLIALVADTLIAIKGNIPINNKINSWSPYQYPENWHTYRDRWLSIYRLRQLLVIAGFISLLAGAVFG